VDRRIVDVVVTSFFIVVGIIILTNDGLSVGGVEASSLGSLFLPRVVASLIIVFSAVVGIQSLLSMSKKSAPLDEEQIDMSGFLGVNIYVGVFIAYWFFTPYVGFLVTTPVVMMVIAFLLGGRNWWTMSAVAIMTTVMVFYGCRHFLRVFLPTWSLA